MHQNETNCSMFARFHQTLQRRDVRLVLAGTSSRVAGGAASSSPVIGETIRGT